MYLRDKKLFGLLLPATLLVSATLCLFLPARAEVSESDIVNAVTKAKILQSGYAVSATVSGDQIVINTYKNPNNSDNDNKIDAILIAKTAFDLAGDSAARVTVRFYAHDLSAYDEVAVTAGDVKAFGSGQINKDQLLSSLTLEPHRMPNASDKLALQLQGVGTLSRDMAVHSDPTTHTVEVVSSASPSVSDDQLKLNAVLMAVNAKPTLPEGTQRFKVTFIDPGYRGETRQFSFNPDDIDAMWQRVQAPLSAFAVIKSPASLDFLRVTPGPCLNERAALLQRLKDLHKSGVGVSSLVNSFLALEDGVHRLDDATVRAQIKRLNDSLDQVEQAMAAAKKPVAHTIGKSTGGVAALPPELARLEHGIKSAGGLPVIPLEVLNNASLVAQKFESALSTRPKDLAVAYLKIAGILRENNRASEAVPLEQKAIALWNTGR